MNTAVSINGSALRAILLSHKRCHIVFVESVEESDKGNEIVL